MSERVADCRDSLPPVAFGTWRLEREQAGAVICSAIQAGYRHIDTAAAYANESEVGEGIRASGIARERLFVSGKLWNSKRSYDAALKACKRSLRILGLDYFDQYLIHWPASPKLHENWREINAEAWRALEALYDEGAVRRIGVCNFKAHHLEALLPHARLKPMVNQLELHPGYTQSEAAAFCRGSDIELEAWSPLGNGQLLADSLVRETAKKYGCTCAQLCLRWCIQYGAHPITKTVNKARMSENLDVGRGPVIGEADMRLLTDMEICAFSGMDPDEITDFG